jgi:hypothetical protein
MFLSSSLDGVLPDSVPSNTWRASSRQPPSKPTDHPRTCPLASDRAPPSQVLSRSPSSSTCPHPSVRTRRAPRPDSVCHVLAEHTGHLLDKTAPRPPLATNPPPHHYSHSPLHLRNTRGDGLIRLPPWPKTERARRSATHCRRGCCSSLKFPSITPFLSL